MRCLLLLLPLLCLALDNGLGRTPQMGWNSWNHFWCGIDEQLIRSTADTIVSTGLAAAGYKYINLDDCWQVSRDSTGRIVPDSKFPSGIKSLSDYIHAKGLKFGLYSDAGYKTCAGRPASLGYEKIDATTYAEWDVDYLKYDNCNTDGSKPEVRYPVMRDALNSTGRPIFFSMCEWGVDDPATWSTPVGNSWRTTGDIEDKWDSMMEIADANDKWWQAAGPGHWNDPDMLEVGNGGMKSGEYRVHFFLWSLMKAPLLVGCDVTKMSAETKALLTAPEVIAVNQDTLGAQGHKVAANNGSEVWAGPLSDGTVAAVLLNRGDSTAEVTITLADLQAATTPAQWPRSVASFAVRDLFARKDLGSFAGKWTVTLPSHDATIIRATPKY